MHYGPKRQKGYVAVMTMRLINDAEFLSKRAGAFPGGNRAVNIRSAIWRECATKEENGDKRFALKSKNKV